MAAREAWVRTKTPMEITAANHARQRLKRLGVIKAVHLIPDDRAPKRPRTPFSWFVMTKNKEGVFQSGGTPTEVMKALGKEWRSMDAAAKQVSRCIPPFYLSYTVTGLLSAVRNGLLARLDRRANKCLNHPALHR